MLITILSDRADPMNRVDQMTPDSDVNLTGPMALEDAKHAWYADAEHAIEYLARTEETFTADDVRSLIGSPRHPNWWGGIFATMRSRGVIEPIGFAVARTQSRNGGSLKVWRSAV